MNTMNITKLIVAVVITLAITIGSGIVADEMGLSVTPTAHACTHGSGGGGEC